MAASSNLGFVAGPALAGLLGAMGLGELPPIIAACAISGLAILIIGLGLPETTPGALSADPAQVNVRKVLGQQHKECFTMPAARKLTIAEILALPSMNLMLAVYFLVFLGFNLFYVAFPVYATTAIAWSLTQIGVYFSAMGLMMALAQGAVLKQLSQRWSDLNLMVGGSILLAASFLFFTATRERIRDDVQGTDPRGVWRRHPERDRLQDGSEAGKRPCRGPGRHLDVG
jgi:Na+/melibiose symporter-like transporter